MVVEIFGFLAAGTMVVLYALEARSHGYVLAFAAACAAAALYATLIGSRPFAALEALWSVVAARRWWLLRASDS